MKKSFILSLITLLSFQTVFAQSNHKKRKLIWSDEFNYTGLPDSTKWGYEEGFVRNNESQYYTKARKENAWVDSGFLTITGRKEAYPNPHYKPGSQKWRAKDSMSAYTSAAITTQGKKAFTYGRIEIRAKIAQGLGVWPAFWMLGTDAAGWPYAGEIDIMEFVGHDSSHIYGTIHYADTTAKHEHAGASKSITTQQPYNGFHVYAIEWNAKEINVFFDDSIYHHFNIAQAGSGSSNPFRKPFYILLNMALGGSWGGRIDDANLPQKYLVDYVRVYAPNP